jgi:hypothetical protein
MPVMHVDKTRVFARRTDDRTQALAYAMQVEAAGDLAMVLPLPTDLAAGEEAVRFVDLSQATHLFNTLDALFPAPELEASLSFGFQTPRQAKPQTLVVHTVGDYEASFVPTAGDFERLDARFRLSPAIVEALCAREPMGFAVFQLRGFGKGEAAPLPWWRRLFGGDHAAMARKTFHPMGLTFRSREPETLFFPTVHVHDGTLPATARFDHALYAQGATDASWETSALAPDRNLVGCMRGILAEGERVRRLTMTGELPNRDVRVPA